MLTPPPTPLQISIEQLDKGLIGRDVCLPQSELRAIIEIYDLDRNEALNRAEFGEMVIALTVKKAKEVADDASSDDISTSRSSSVASVSRASSHADVVLSRRASSRGGAKGGADGDGAESSGFSRRPPSSHHSPRKSRRGSNDSGSEFSRPGSPADAVRPTPPRTPKTLMQPPASPSKFGRPGSTMGLPLLEPLAESVELATESAEAMSAEEGQDAWEDA